MDINNLLNKLEKKFFIADYYIAATLVESMPDTIKKLEYRLKLKAIKSIFDENFIDTGTLDSVEYCLDNIIKNNNLVLLGVFS